MRLIALLMVMGLTVSSYPSFAQAQLATPLEDGYVHEGVMSCYGSACHSRQSASGSNVRQNEYVTWQDQNDISGAHSRAYKVLLNSKSRTIARNLGIGPAHKASECLACHADNVAEQFRGDMFDIAEGVSCEACHGGSEKWLTSHPNANRTHAQNIADGLYPTDDPEARARLCLGCHLGSTRQDQFVNHKIMGAGHPRISFELDLFTNLQKHHDEDSDYGERKTITSGVKVWAIGQAISLQTQLALFADDQLGRSGAFPELVFFDCHACHVTFSNDPNWRPTWRSNPERGLGPGVPIFNDANLIMLKAAADTVRPELEDELKRAGIIFHKSVSASNGGSYAAASAELSSIVDKLVTEFKQTEFSKEDTVAIMKTIVNSNATSRYTEYAAAEQAVIAVDTFLEALTKEEHISLDQAKELRPVINAAYDVVSEPNTYSQSRMQNAFRNIADKVNRL